MKKFLLIAAAFLLFGITACNADNDRIIQLGQLPTAAQDFIKTFFPAEKVNFVKEDRELFEHRYEVSFASGTSIEFYKNGEWKEVDCRMSPLPAGICPEPIVNFVKDRYTDATINAIDWDKHDYEVKLSNRLELTFDKNFNLIDMDD